jgi:hypothetical protein
MATNNSLTQSQIPSLTEKNYDSWFIRMRTILRSQDLWEFVTIGYPDPVDQATEIFLTNVER